MHHCTDRIRRYETNLTGTVSSQSARVSVFWYTLRILVHCNTGTQCRLFF